MLLSNSPTLQLSNSPTVQLPNGINYHTRRKMRYLLLLLFVLPIGMIAQQYPARLIPDSLLENAHTVIREYRASFEARRDRPTEWKVTEVYTVLNAEGDNVAYVPYQESLSNVTKLEGTLYDKNGQQIKRAKKNDAYDGSMDDGFSLFSDSRFKGLRMSHHEYPYTVRYDYTVRDRDRRFIPSWRILPSYGYALQQGVYEVYVDAENPIYYQTRNLDLEPQRTDIKDDGTLYTWRAKNLTARTREPYTDEATVFPRVVVSPESFPIEDFRGSMKDWKSFGATIEQLNAEADNLDPATTRRMAELTAGIEDVRERVRLVYEYLQQNVRYVSVQIGIGGWKTFDAAYVDENKFGDCKALSYYTRSLLRGAGVEAHPVLIHSGDAPPDLREDFVDATAFNHMILYVPATEQFLECTSKQFPPGYVGSGNDDREVLVVTPEGGKIMRTPTIGDDLEEQTATVEMTPEGGAVVRGALRHTGESHERYRYYADKIDDDFRTGFLDEFALPGSAEFTDLSIEVSAENGESTIEYALDVKNYGSQTGGRYFVPLNTLSRLDFVPPRNPDRTQPVVRAHNYRRSLTSTLQLPKGYHVESLPEAKEIESVFGTYRASVREVDGALVYERELVMRPSTRPASEYSDLRSFFRKVSKADKAKVVLVMTP